MLLGGREAAQRQNVRKLRLRPHLPTHHYGGSADFDQDRMYEYLEPNQNMEYFENLDKFNFEEQIDYQGYDYAELGNLDFTKRSWTWE